MQGVITQLASIGAARWGSAPACHCADRTLDFGEIDLQAGRFATGLAARGVGPGDRVVLHLPNGWRWIVAYHAIMRLGAVVVPANILLSAAEVGYVVADSEARLAVLPDDRRALIHGLAGAVTVGGSVDPGDVVFDALLDADWRAPAPVAPDDLATIAYTSGTTGNPKGAMQSHANVFASVAHTATIHVRHAGDRIYSALPFPHVYGNVVMNACFLTGASLRTVARFDAGEALAAIGRERITLFEGVPTMYYQMLGHPSLAKADLSSLTRCTVGGQTMPIAMMEKVVDRFGCPLLELWGMTEVSGPAATHSPFWPPRLGSIGLPFPGTEVRIAGAGAPGDVGEIEVRGPLVTAGYWRNPEASAAAIDADGWLATGDVGRIDDKGYLYVVDRLKDVIITAGYNIYPAEIERVLALHPAVAMSAVAGAFDEERGEVARAFVVLAPGGAADAPALDAHCRGHLAAYKVPRGFSFVDDLPKTSTGKILRRALREHLPIPA